MIGWSVLGVVVLLAAGLSVGNLDDSPSRPLVDSNPPTTERSAPTTAPARENDSIEQALNQADTGTALAGLGDLSVHRRGTSSGYARSRFGSILTDTDGNGCDQRNDVLRRDLTGKTFRPGSSGCTVTAGTLSDPYTGRSISYLRATHGRVRIDQVVSLGDAWVKGARAWSVAQRAAFATDPLNLLAVGAQATGGKGSADAAHWLPAATGYRCPYVARQVAVKRKYELWVSPTERTTIARILTQCQSQTLPSDRLIALGGTEPAIPER